MCRELLEKGLSPCKGFRLCKLLCLVQILKMRKTCQNQFYNNLKLLYAENHLKTTNYSRIEAILKIGHLAKAKPHAKAIAYPKCSVLVKN